MGEGGNGVDTISPVVIQVRVAMGVDTISPVVIRVRATMGWIPSHLL